MNKTITTVISIVLLSSAASFALAKEHEDLGCQSKGGHCWSAPEIDPGQALGALTLLAGTIAIVRGYRRRK